MWIAVRNQAILYIKLGEGQIWTLQSDKEVTKNDSNERWLRLSMSYAENYDHMIRMWYLSDVLSYFKVHHNRWRRRLAGDSNDLSSREERRTVSEDFTLNLQNHSAQFEARWQRLCASESYLESPPLLLLSSLLFLLLDSFSRRKVSDRNLSLEVYQSHLRRRILSQK